MCRLVLLTENNRRNNKYHGRFGPRIVPCLPEIFFFLLDEHALSPFMTLLSLLVYVGGLHHYILWCPCIRQIAEWAPQSKATGRGAEVNYDLQQRTHFVQDGNLTWAGADQNSSIGWVYVTLSFFQANVSMCTHRHFISYTVSTGYLIKS